MSELPEDAQQTVDEIVHPLALCRGNWTVLYENGEVFPVKYFVDKDGFQLPTHKRATGVLADGPNNKTFFLKFDDIDQMSLH